MQVWGSSFCLLTVSALRRLSWSPDVWSSCKHCGSRTGKPQAQSLCRHGGPAQSPPQTTPRAAFGTRAPALAMPTPPPPHTQEDRTRMGQDGTRGPVPEPQSSRGWAEEGGAGSQRAPDCNRVGDLSRCPSWAAKTCPQTPVLRGQQTTWGLESLGNVASAWRLAAATVF